MSIEVMISTSLSILAVFVATSALIASLGNDSGQSTLLVYDRDDIADQSRAYIEAGQDPMVVIDTALKEAIRSGFIVIDSGQRLRAPSDTLLRLDRFVAVGSETGRKPPPLELSLPGTTAVPGQPVGLPDDGQAGQIGDDGADVAREIGGAISGFTPAPAPE